jgi:hypothetical protein
MDDNRSKSKNCQRCDKFENNMPPTDSCTKCPCLNCIEILDNCLRNKFCKHNNVPIESL